jgi:plastocyanin
MNGPYRRFACFVTFVRFAVIGLAACLAAPAVAAGDFIYGDDFETAFVCPAGPGPAIAAAMSPASIKTSLGTQNRYLVKVLSCGFSGNVTLTPGGAPASWTLAMDPSSVSLALNSVKVAQLTATVPTDGDAGDTGLVVPLSVDAVASGANTVSLSADLDVANEFAIHFAPDGTGSGTHAFLPAFLQIKVGAKLRFISDDSTAGHNIHAQDATAGFNHQPTFLSLGQGEEYDITATGTVSGTPVYCHAHPGTGQMAVTAIP